MRKGSYFFVLLNYIYYCHTLKHTYILIHFNLQTFTFLFRGDNFTYNINVNFIRVADFNTIVYQKIYKIYFSPIQSNFKTVCELFSICKILFQLYIQLQSKCSLQFIHENTNLFIQTFDFS